MKYLLIFLISFSIFTPVYAAKSVKGSIPVVTPLQPPAAGVSPDFNHNIESTAAPSVGQQDSSAAAQSQSPNAVQNSSVTDQPSSQPGKPNLLVLFALIAIGAGILGFVWMRRNK